MALPDFLVIGAPKAGSTALHAALAQHPALHMSAVKEPKFFLSDGPPPARGGPGDAQTYREHVWRRPDYEALFDGAPPGALRGESTPLYLHDPAAHRRIRAMIPEARLIAVLRDPVERAHSNWTHLWSAGLEPIGDFVRACEEEPRRIEAGWASFWHYTGLGRYGEQLEHLYRAVPPRAGAGAALPLPGGQPGGDARPDLRLPRRRARDHRQPAAGERDRASRGDASPPQRWPGRRGPPPRWTGSCPAPPGRPLSRRLEHTLQRSAPPRQPLTWDEREQVLPYFEADIRLLERVTGDDFSFWLRPRERSGGMVGSRPTGQRQARNGQPRRRRAGAGRPSLEDRQRSSVRSSCAPSGRVIS